MAKLSLWLITMDRERPFGFLDDRLKPGDSLLGLVSIDQLEVLHVDAKEGRRLHHGTLDFAEGWRSKLADAADLRRRITATQSVTIRDIEHKARLNAQAESLSGEITTVANAITATGVAAAKLKGKKLDEAFLSLYVTVSNDDTEKLTALVKKNLQDPRPAGTVEREPFHWPLAFPEIFADTTNPGFAAIIGNPPFLGGQKISGTYGDDYLAWLQRWDGNDVKGSADLAARFVLRANRLLSRRGQLGFVTDKHSYRGCYAASRNGASAMPKNPRMDVRPIRGPPLAQACRSLSYGPAARRSRKAPPFGGWRRSSGNRDLTFEPYGRVRAARTGSARTTATRSIGSYVLGLGFTLTEEQKDELIAHGSRNAEVIQPYVIGKDLNQRPDCSAADGSSISKTGHLIMLKNIPTAWILSASSLNQNGNEQEESSAGKYGGGSTRPAPELYEAIERTRPRPCNCA